ncbi:MAG: glycine zipper domain-containing protein [Candidatus Hydrogenedentes bacterium]|nr:glycine zipper domain-containing protein [Candidatus Hydrogenedentota bacterium]
MTSTKRWMTGLLACCLLLSLVGCQTYGEAGGLGAALGAGAGAIIGNQSGHAMAGALIGAALGGLTGIIAHDIKARKAKDRQQTVEAYNYQPSQGEVLRLEESVVSPNVTSAGSMIEATLQYAIIGTGGGTQVKETRRLLRGERVIGELSSKSFTRQDGTWVTTQQFKLPSNLKPGRYSLIQKVETGKSSIFGTAEFTIQ